MNFKTRTIVRGSFGLERTKTYVHVDPIKGQLTLRQYALVTDLNKFPGLVIKKEFKGKFLINQNCGFKLQTVERFIDIIDTTVDFYNKYRKNI